MFKNLADIQLHKMIQKGKHVEACKEAWKRKHGREYPEFKKASGVKRYGE